MSSLNGTETLVIPRGESLENGLDKLDRRLAGVETAPASEEEPKGQSLGLALTSISQGDPKDRLSEGLRNNYEELIQKEFVIFELELTSFKARSRQRLEEVKTILKALREFVGIVEGRIYEWEPSDDGARVLLSTSGTKLQALVEDMRWQLCITFFDERPRFQTFHQTVSQFNIGQVTVLPPPTDAETICIIDSGVAAGNPLIGPVLRRDLCRSYVPDCAATVDESDHGTGVASLAAFYDIDPSSGATMRGRSWIASARILTEDGFLDRIERDDEGQMRIAHARLLSSLLREIVSDYHSLGVRIFVLSFNIPGHYWSEANQGIVLRNGWVARTIDQLCREFDVTFVAITGNLGHREVELLHGKDPYPRYLSRPLAKILDPGQSALAVTVGAVAHSARVSVQNATAIADEGKPSPFTRSGPGFGQAIKPDFIERGGNYVSDNETLRVGANESTSVLMASNKLTPALKTNVGTSFAAPRVAYHAGVIAYELRKLGIQPSGPLLRAVLAASAECPSDLHEWCRKELGDLDASLSTVGYGLPSSSRALECSLSSVILHYQGELEVGKVAFFEIPVPQALADTPRSGKRIIVSLATSPPVQRWGLGEYLGAQAKFRLFRGDIPRGDVEDFMCLEEGSSRLKPKIEEHIGELGINRRSVGSLQREVYLWKQHGRGYSDQPYLLAVALKGSSWLRNGESIKIGVAVRLEEQSGQCNTLYTYVSAAVQTEAEAEAQG